MHESHTQCVSVAALKYVNKYVINILYEISFVFFILLSGLSPSSRVEDLTSSSNSSQLDFLIVDHHGPKNGKRPRNVIVIYYICIDLI